MHLSKVIDSCFRILKKAFRRQFAASWTLTITWNGNDITICFLGDEAFPLKENLLRPYPGKNLTEGQLNFNFRLSRARKLVENAFGILAARFRVFRRPMLVTPIKAEMIVKAATVLHNFFAGRYSSMSRE